MSGLAQVEVCPHAHTRPRTRISYRLANRAAPVCNGLCGDRPLLRGGNPINQKGLLQTQGKEGRRPAEASLVSSSPAAPQGLPRVTPWFLDRHTISSFLRRSHRQAKYRPRLRTGLYLAHAFSRPAAMLPTVLGKRAQSCLPPGPRLRGRTALTPGLQEPRGLGFTQQSDRGSASCRGAGAPGGSVG